MTGERVLTDGWVGYEATFGQTGSALADGTAIC